MAWRRDGKMLCSTGGEECLLWGFEEAEGSHVPNVKVGVPEQKHSR